MQTDTEILETYLMNKKQVSTETETHYAKNGEQICRYKPKYKLPWAENHLGNLQSIRQFRQKYHTPVLPTHARRMLLS